MLQLLWSSKALNLIFILETERFDRVKVQTEWLLSHRVQAERFDRVKLLPQRVQTQWLVSHRVEADWLRRVKLNRGRIKTRRFGGVQAESVQVFHFPTFYFFPLGFPIRLSLFHSHFLPQCPASSFLSLEADNGKRQMPFVLENSQIKTVPRSSRSLKQIPRSNHQKVHPVRII